LRKNSNNPSSTNKKYKIPKDDKDIEKLLDEKIISSSEDEFEIPINLDLIKYKKKDDYQNALFSNYQIG